MARVLVTGSTQGLGLAAGRALAAAGHRVVFHARSAERAAAIEGVAEVVTGDLRSAEAVRGVAEQVGAIGGVDAVIHNAGVYLQEERGETPEGHPVTLAVNTLAPYLLTALIQGPSRLVYLSSGLHRDGEGSLDDLAWSARPWNAARAYAESKLHAVALAAALARRRPDVLANAVDPGWVRTRMGGAAAPVDIDTGQRTQAWLAVSEDAAVQVSGGYWRNLEREAPAAEALDPRFQDDLLAALERLTGVRLPPAA